MPLAASIQLQDRRPVSSHSLKAKRRYPDPKTFKRELFPVAHLTFELIDHPEYGQTFALIPHMSSDANGQKPLFSGHIPKGMSSELRSLAMRIYDLDLMPLGLKTQTNPIAADNFFSVEQIQTPG